MKNISVGFLIGILSYFLFNKFKKKIEKKKNYQSDNASNGAFLNLIGNTLLVKIKCLSDDLGIEVLGKAEFMNPGGSVKDRLARALVLQSKENRVLCEPRDEIYEATSGSTGISLTLASKVFGYLCKLYIPLDQSRDKFDLLNLFGADVKETFPCSIIDKNHFYNLCKSDFMKQSVVKAVFADQFENNINFETHYKETGVEILNQTNFKIDAFVASSGTGGTITGVSMKLKEHLPLIKIILADPEGSALLYKVNHGVLYNPKDAEGNRKKKFVDTIIEGVGINRLTENFNKGCNNIDIAFRVSDLECVHMSRYLLENEGLFLGSSSALNCCALVKAVKAGIIKPASRVVVMLCDNGYRHLSKFYSNDFLESNNLLPNYIKYKNKNTFNIDTIRNDETVSLLSNNGESQRVSIKSLKSNYPPKTVFDFID